MFLSCSWGSIALPAWVSGPGGLITEVKPCPPIVVIEEINPPETYLLDTGITLPLRHPLRGAATHIVVTAPVHNILPRVPVHNTPQGPCHLFPLFPIIFYIYLLLRLDSPLSPEVPLNFGVAHLSALALETSIFCSFFCFLR